MFSTALLYLLLSLGCIVALGLLLAPLCLASGVWAWRSGQRDAARADTIDRLLADT